MINRPLPLMALAGLLSALPLPAAQAGNAPDHWPDDAAIPTVLTVTRLRQAQAETPASVTILDRDFIRASGIRNLPELLRYVPGMSVGSRDGHNYTVSQHGTTFSDSRRMQVLVDGRSVYSIGLSDVKWTDLPLVLDDIERIEVTRGPNAAAYGANAFLGVINIITRDPRDSHGVALSTRQGNGGVEDYQLRYADRSDQAHWRLTLASRHDDGFDVRRDGITDRRDSNDQWQANGRLVIDPGSDWLLDLQAGYKTGTNTEELLDASMLTTPDMDYSHGFVSVRGEKQLSDRHALQVTAYYTREKLDQDWISCLPPILLNPDLARLYQTNPAYTETLLDGGNPIGSGGGAEADALALAVLTEYFSLGGPAAPVSCGKANQHSLQTRYDLEVQDTFVFNDQLRLVSGLNLRRDKQDSQTYLGGAVDRDSLRLFAHAEYRPHPRWLINIGGFYEDEDGARETFAPRAAVNVHLAAGHTLRAVYSTAYRMPDIFEEHADWSYTLTGLNPPYRGGHTAQYFPRAISPGNLDNERIVSSELGYFGSFPQHGLQIDFRLFENRMTDLISQSMSLEKFTPANTPLSLHHTGAETEIRYQPTRDLLLRLTYAYIDVKTDIWLWKETLFTPKNAGSLFARWRLPQAWDVAVGYYYADNINFKHFSRADLRVAKTLTLGRSELELAAIVQHRFDDDGDIFSDNLYKDDSRLFMQAELRF